MVGRIRLLVLVGLAGGLLAPTRPAVGESYVLPSSAFRSGANAAEYRTDVRLLNQGASAVTVTATFYDQTSGVPLPASPFQVEGRSQASFDNILQSLFGKSLAQGSFGPVRFDTTAPLLVAASVNNVNACGSGAVSGQWLPAIDVNKALNAGVIGQLAASASGNAGYRTNIVFMNPGGAPATATVKVRRGGGALLATGTIGPLAANGFSQVALDGAAFPGVAGTTDTNLWLEFTSDQPLFAYATIIHNVSGDPFAVVANADTPPSPSASLPRLYLSGMFGGDLATTPTPVSSASYVCLSTLDWSTTLSADVAGGAYTFNLGLVTSNTSSGSGSMRGDIILKRGSTETVLATTTFTTSPQYQVNHLTVSGTDPDSRAGDSLLLRLTRVSGLPCIYWSPGAGTTHYIEVAAP